MNCCDKTNLKTFEGCSYKGLSPFKYFCLTTFPYIEADFDALTNYELLCKIIEYLNNTMQAVNDIGLKTSELCQAFTELKNYVDNYFDNLDVTEKINNKLDEMFENGQLTTIINNYMNNFMPVSVKNYGAVGDGITDDTEAFQDAIDSGFDVYIPLSRGEHYLITDTLNITNDRQEFFSTANERVFDETVSEYSKMGYIIFDNADSTKALFSAIGYTGLRFYNLTLCVKDYTPYNYKHTAILINATTIRDNADALISGCTFYGFNICVENYGRGTFFKNNQAFHFTKVYVQHYTYDGTGGYDVQQPPYGDRALVFTNNRMHVGNIAIELHEGILNGAEITNNLIDGGGQLINATADCEGIVNCQISGNTNAFWNRGQYIFINCTGAVKNNIIANNVIGALDTHVSNFRFLQVSSNVTEFSFNSINDNVIKRCRDDLILIEALIIKGNAFSGNVIQNGCFGTGNHLALIRFNQDVESCTFIGNILFIDSNSQALYAIRFNGSVSKCYETGNLTNAPTFNFILTDGGNNVMQE